MYLHYDAILRSFEIIIVVEISNYIARAAHILSFGKIYDVANSALLHAAVLASYCLCRNIIFFEACIAIHELIGIRVLRL